MYSEAVLTSTHNLCSEQKYEKYRRFLSENFQFFGDEIFYVFELACFRNDFEKGSFFICLLNSACFPILVDKGLIRVFIIILGSL